MLRHSVRFAAPLRRLPCVENSQQFCRRSKVNTNITVSKKDLKTSTTMCRSILVNQCMTQSGIASGNNLDSNFAKNVTSNIFNSTLANNNIDNDDANNNNNINNKNSSTNINKTSYTREVKSYKNESPRLNFSPRPYSRAAQKLNQTSRGPIKDRYPPMAVDVQDPRRRLAVLIDSTNSRLLPLLKSNVHTQEQALKEQQQQQQQQQHEEEYQGNSTLHSTWLNTILTDSALYTTILPSILQVGVPVLMRVFAHDLPREWEVLIAGNSVANNTSLQSSLSSSSSPSSSSSSSTSPLLFNPTLSKDAFVNNSQYGVHRHRTTLPLPERIVNKNNNTSSVRLSEMVAKDHKHVFQCEYFRVEKFIPISMQIEADAQHIFDFRNENKIEGVCYVCSESDRTIYENILQRQYKGLNSLFALTNSENENTANDAEEMLLKRQDTNNMHSSESSRATISSSSSSSSSSSLFGDTSTKSKFFNQYLLDELGMIKNITVDGRSEDGS